MTDTSNLYIITSAGELRHYGIRGMKWGVRKIKTSLNKKVGIQFFARRASSCKTIKLSKKEYAHVMSELASHITEAQRRQPVITKPIGDRVYIFENHFDNTYRVIGRSKNLGTIKHKGGRNK